MVAGGGSDSDRAALEEAQRKQQEIHAYLKDVDESLTRAASNVKDFSARLDEPERRRVAEVKRSEARLAAQERRNEARDRLDAVTAQANSKARIDSAEVEDRVEAMNIGHREAPEASDTVLNGPTLPAAESPPEVKRPLVSPEAKAAARKNALKAAKWTAEKASRLSASAAKRAAEQLEKRSREK